MFQNTLQKVDWNPPTNAQLFQTVCIHSRNTFHTFLVRGNWLVDEIYSQLEVAVSTHGEPPLRSQIGKSLNVAFNIFQNPGNLKKWLLLFPDPLTQNCSVFETVFRRFPLVNSPKRSFFFARLRRGGFKYFPNFLKSFHVAFNISQHFSNVWKWP